MRIIGALAVLLCVSSAATADIKVTRRVGAGGHAILATIYVKGARERTEMPNNTTIRQCDLRRTIQINEGARKYVITPDADADSSNANAPAPQQRPKATRRGGVITYTVNVNDTGERKQMFGYTARHIKSTTVMDAPADTCSPGHFEIESDGWYIDFAAGGPSCDANRPALPPTSSTRPDCQDTFRYRTTGSGRLGFPVSVTTRYKTGAQGDAGDGAEVSAAMSAMMTSTLEVTDISTLTLDPSLFDIPSGYTQAASMQELYSPAAGMASTGGMAGMMPPGARPPADTDALDARQRPRPKQPGAVRIGVAAINNRAGGTVSLAALREGLVAALTDSNVEAVAIDASEPSAADAEAKAKECDFVLYTDLSALSQSAAGKVGGMFGRVTGVRAPGSERYDSRVDFRLVATGGSASQLESSAAAKEEGADASVTAALEREARAVIAAARRKK
jgi:hypothetical protein